MKQMSASNHYRVIHRKIRTRPDCHFSFARNQAAIAAEAQLDGFYVDENFGLG
jgi:hypothetical protein